MTENEIVVYDEAELVPYDDTAELTAEAIEGLMNEVSVLSGKVYRSTVNQYIEWAKANPHKRAGASVAGFISYMHKDMKLSPATVNKKATIVRRLFDWFARVGLITGNDLVDVRSVKTPKFQGKRAGRWLNEEQLKRLMRTVNNPRDKAILALLVGCGLRCSEVVNFKWSQIEQTSDGTYVIVNLHRKHNRIQPYVPLPYWVHETLLSLNRVDDSDTVIFLTTRQIYNIVKYWSRKANCNVAPHDLRRSAAQLALDKGQSLTQVSRLLGHSNTIVTERYLKQDFDLTAMADAMELKYERRYG